MAKSKKNLSAIQAWMDSRTGQMFLNYAYSWGASIVILGALFKLTHIAGANLMLFIGMGTEVVVFFLSGFERPWTDDGKADTEETATAETEAAPAGDARPAAGGTVVVGGSGMGGGTIIINGGAGAGSVAAAAAPQGSPVDAAELAENLSELSIPQPAGMSPEMSEATAAYVVQLNELTDTLKKVAEQSARLTRDSEEMETMNRTLTGINRFYEMQLRSVGQQSATIDDVNTQSKRLAEQLADLNDVYARMIEALKLKVG